MLIYIITNTINDKVYIGQTIRTLNERIRNYKNEVKFAKVSRPIIDAMRKYGIENFSWNILEDNITTKEELDKKEQDYILQYKSLCNQNGYNVELGGNGNGKHSKETKRKIGEAQKGSKNHMFGKTGELNVTSKKIIELTTGKIFGSASEASKYFDLNFSHVCATERGTRGSTGNRIFRYVDENLNIIQPEEITLIKNKNLKNQILPQFQKYI